MKGLAEKRIYNERYVQAIDAIKKERGIRFDADICRALGLTSAQIVKLRQGTQIVQLDNITKLTEVYRVNPAFIVEGSGPMFLPPPSEAPDEQIRSRIVDIVENELTALEGKPVEKLFYDKESITVSAYRDYKHRRILTASKRLLSFLEKAYRVNRRYIETGEGEKFLQTDSGTETRTDSKTVTEPSKEFSPTVITIDRNNEDVMVVVPQKAAAHYYEGWADPEFQESLEVMQIPGMPRGKTTRAFPVNGDSMQPRLHNGALVACFQVDPRKIKEGFIHAVVTADGVVVHRVFKRGDNFRLVPDNPLFRPIDIPVKEVWEIWEVWNAVISDFPPPDDVDAKVNHLQVELLQFKSEVKDEIRETAELVRKVAHKVGIR